MRMIFALVLLVGVALAGFAVYMAQDYIRQTQAYAEQLAAEQAKAPKLVDVVIVKRPLKYGERFTMADLDIAKVEATKVPAGYYTLISAPMEANPAPGTPVPVFYEGETRPRAALRSFEQNEPLLGTKITKPGVDAGITARLSPNMRAFTIKVDVTSGVSGFLRPGDRVDVYWSGNTGQREVTKLLEAGLLLIAIDQSADADRTEETSVANTVTAEVTPEQAAALALAQSTGRLTLSLVGATDTGSAGPVEIDRNTLLGITEEAGPAPVVEERVCTIRTNKGGEVVETPIPCSD